MSLKGILYFKKGNYQSEKQLVNFRKKRDDLDTYFWRPCLIVSGVKKAKNKSMENLKKTITDKLE